MAKSPRSKVLLACVVVGAVAFGPVPAVTAQDQNEQGSAPSFVGESATGDGELDELAELSREAGALGEELHTARAELDESRLVAAEKRVRAEKARALADEADRRAVTSQHVVDSVAVQRYRAGGSDVRHAALLSSGPKELVDRMAILRVLSGVNVNRLDDSRTARDDAEALSGAAEDVAREADAATEDAASRAEELERRHEDLQERMDAVMAAVDAFDAEARATWTGQDTRFDLDSATLGDGDNIDALRTAATRMGAPYSWGATGPDSFDCSGLMVWAYAQHGKTLPRSSQMQAQSGTPVEPEDIRPGDLVIYFSGATHVGMYAGNGQVLHASTYGVPVGLDPVDSMPIHSIRRY